MPPHRYRQTLLLWNLTAFQVKKKGLSQNRIAECYWRWLPLFVTSEDGETNFNGLQFGPPLALHWIPKWTKNEVLWTNFGNICKNDIYICIFDPDLFFLFLKSPYYFVFCPFLAFCTPGTPGSSTKLQNHFKTAPSTMDL